MCQGTQLEKPQNLSSACGTLGLCRSQESMVRSGSGFLGGVVRAEASAAFLTPLFLPEAQFLSTHTEGTW